MMGSIVRRLHVLGVLVALASSSYILDIAEKYYPNAEEREKNLISAMNTLKNVRLDALHEKNTAFLSNNPIPDRKEPATVLCISFIEPTFKHLAVAEYNMKVSAKLCDWGILHVGNDDLKIIQVDVDYHKHFDSFHFSNLTLSLSFLPLGCLELGKVCREQ